MYRSGFFAGHGGGGHHVLGILFLVAFLVAIVVLVVFVIRWARSGPPASAPAAPAPTSADAAVAAARMRYARGELSREDFLRISADLHYHDSGSPGSACRARPRLRRT